MRFATARDVGLAYPEMASELRSRLDDTPSRAFLDRLAAERPRADAVSFIAYLLPRREAVWWAVTCVRLEPKAFEIAEQPLLAAAATWVADPNDGDRGKLLAAGTAADPIRPATWIALAVGWSGGLLHDGGLSKVMCQPHMSPAAVRAAVLLASSFAADAQAFLGRCLDEGRTILSGSQN